MIRGRHLLQPPLRAFTAARTVLMIAQYFAGLMRGPKWLYLELTNTCNADMLVNYLPLSLTMARGFCSVQ